MVQVHVVGLAVDTTSNSPVVLLQELNGTRLLPIWIGPAEATAIAVQLEGRKMARPLTHDLLKSIILGLDAEVVKVIVSDLKESTFFARIFIKQKANLFSIDARPSDSIALALRTQSPIYVQEEMVKMELDLSQFIMKTEKNVQQGLKDYLSKLKPDDLGRIEPEANE